MDKCHHYVITWLLVYNNISLVCCCFPFLKPRAVFVIRFAVVFCELLSV